VAEASQGRFPQPLSMRSGTPPAAGAKYRAAFRLISPPSSEVVNSRWVMDEVPPRSDSQEAYRVRPRCGGGNLGHSPAKETQEGPGGGPSCVFWGLKGLLKLGARTADAPFDSQARD